ncbi:MAG: protein-disulfide reductase DsbD domain-containing protein [Alphaproteobacteria bacterium]
MAIALGALSTLAVPSAKAESGFASPWGQEQYARVRLIAGATSQNGTRQVGVQIELNQGWHTYWRHPGDSGVPPQFGWGRSKNLNQAQNSWPAPTRLVSEYGVSYGYYDAVVFPITITPATEGPVHLNLDLIYAACREICFPLQAKLALTLPAAQTASSPFARLLANAQSRVPAPQTPTGRPRISGATPTTSAGRVILQVKAELAGPGEAANLFVEGPNQFYFRVAGKPRVQTGTTAIFDVSVEGARDISQIRGAEVTATLVTTSGQVEHHWVID